MPPGKAPEQVDPQTLDDYLDVMSKAVFQSGISWKVVEAKWPSTREAFHNFDVQEVANMNEKDIDDLSNDTRVIRNYRKLQAIVTNAQRMLDLEAEHGAFKNYLQSQDDFDSTLKMIRKDFKFMGPFGIYYFLYVVGEEVPPHEDFDAQYRKK